MKNYSVKYDLKDRSPKTIYVSKNSSYKVSFDAVNDGERCETIKLYEGEVELSSSGVFHDEIQFDMTAPSTPTRNEYKVVADDIAMKFNVIVTDSDVAELPGGQGGGSEYVLPVATSTVLGGVKVGSGLVAAADGTLCAIGGSGDETDPVFTAWKTGAYDIQVGGSTYATGSNTTAIGGFATANGNNTTAVGNGAKANGANTTAFGYNATAYNDGVAIGANATGNGDAVAVGKNTNTGAQAVAIGISALAGSYATAIGGRANAWNQSCVAIGWETSALDQEAIAIGVGAKAQAYGAVQIGEGTNWTSQALQFRSTTIVDYNGNINASAIPFANTSSPGVVVVGSGLSIDSSGVLCAIGGGGGSESDPVFTAWKNSGTLAAGLSANAGGVDTIAIGTGASTFFTGDVAIGAGAGCTASQCIAIGASAGCTGSQCIAIGNAAWADDDYYGNSGGIAIGPDTGIHGYGIAIGKEAKCQYSGVIAAGVSAQATNTDAIAIGRGASVSLPDGVAIGKYAQAGSNSIAIGADAYAMGSNSIQLGQGVIEADNTFQVGGYPVMNTYTGKFESGRIPQATYSDFGGIKAGSLSITHGLSVDDSGYMILDCSAVQLSGTYVGGSSFAFNIPVYQHTW